MNNQNIKYNEQIEELEMSVGTFRTLSNEQAACIVRLEKENTELKAQIEKMKCCENCKHHYWLYEELSCRIHKIDVDTCNSWEMKND